MNNQNEEKTERQKHLDWCKARAAEYIKLGDQTQAFASFMSDMRKNEETANHPVLGLFASMFFEGHFKTTEELGKYIEDFG